MKFLPALLLSCLLSACAVGPAPAPSAAVDPASLLRQMAQLPGARVEAEPLGFSYPDQVLFGRDAVLPLPGGPPLLGPLAQFIKANPGLAWQVDVRASTAQGKAYDQLLAEKRSEVLASYLLSKGAELIHLTFQPQAAAGDPLQFTLKVPQK